MKKDLNEFKKYCDPLYFHNNEEDCWDHLVQLIKELKEDYDKEDHAETELCLKHIEPN